MRLIDADELLKYLNCQDVREDFDCCDNADCRDCRFGYVTKDEIINMPTVYNVDHAVEEMEELRAHYVDACCMCSSSNCGKCYITEFINELERLIEILENGGVKNEMKK